MSSSRTRLKQRAALGALGFVVFALCLVGAFVYGTSFTQPAARGNVTIVEVAQNKLAPPLPEPTPQPPPPAAVPDLSDAAKLALKREEYRSRLEKLGVKSPEYLWFQSERIVIWAQRPATNTGDVEEWPWKHVATLATPALAEEWLNAFEAEYGQSNVGINGEPPLTALVFRDDYSFRRWVWDADRNNVPSWAGGIYLINRDLALVPAGKAPYDKLSTLRHEIFHAFQMRCAPSCEAHRWFVEGSATWVGRAGIHRGQFKRDDWTLRRHYGYLRYLMRCGVALDIRSLVRLTPREFYESPVVNYLAAYLWVDFILHRDDLRKVYFEYWNLMRAGKSADDAFAATFGKLDLNTLNADFLRRIRATPVCYQVPELLCDAPWAKSPNAAMPLPSLSEERDDESVDEVVEKLKAAGFDIDRPCPFDKPIAQAVICVDSSETGSLENLDLPRFNRWLNACRLATTMHVQPEDWELPSDPPISTRAAFILVECICNGKEAAFTTATGIVVSKDTSETVNHWMARIREFKSLRECYEAAADAYLGAALWGDLAITLIDFRSDVVTASTESARITFPSNLFSMAESSRRRAKTDTDSGCDWGRALNKAADVADKKRTLVLFFTHTRHRTGAAAGETLALAANVLDMFKRTGSANLIQILFAAAPGADTSGAGEIVKAISAARLDDWAARFGK